MNTATILDERGSVARYTFKAFNTRGRPVYGDGSVATFPSCPQTLAQVKAAALDFVRVNLWCGQVTVYEGTKTVTTVTCDDV